MASSKGEMKAAVELAHQYGAPWLVDSGSTNNLSVFVTAGLGDYPAWTEQLRQEIVDAFDQELLNSIRASDPEVAIREEQSINESAWIFSITGDRRGKYVELVHHARAKMAAQHPVRFSLFSETSKDADGRRRNSFTAEELQQWDRAAQFLGSLVDQSVLNWADWPVPAMESAPDSFPIRVCQKRQKRASANAGLNTIYLSPDSRDDVFLHEAIHLIEGLDDTISRANYVYLLRRTNGMKSRQKLPTSGWGEFYSKGGFLKDYTGKITRPGATEIMTTSVPYLYLDPYALAKYDPETFRHVLFVLQDKGF
jgi:hypothetical protein